MTITSNQAIDLFMKIEDELDLFSYKIDGVYFWERIRFELARAIMQKAGIAEYAHDKLEDAPSKTFRAIKNALLNIFEKNPYLAAQSEILFFGHPRRKLREDGKHEDIYCDSIIDNLNYSYTYLEKPYMGKHLTPATTNNIFYTDFIYLVAAILRKLKIIRVNLSQKDIKHLTGIQEAIKGLYGVELDLVNLVKTDLQRRSSLIPLFILLLKKIKPKLIVVVCSYGKETFIEAAKRLNITVIELQHGNFSSYHLGYSFPGPKRFKRAFPDYFFTFGYMWNNDVELPIDYDKIVNVGFPYLEREVNKYQNVKRKKQIIFLSQGSVGNKMSKFAYELSKVDGLTYKIIYKLHPGEYMRWRKEYPWLQDSSIQVLDNDLVPLHKLLAESMVQVGYSSTALYEGINFNLKTLIYSVLGTGSMKYLIKNKLALEVYTVEDVISILLKMDNLPPIDTSIIFTENALQNIENALCSLLNQSAH